MIMRHTLLPLISSKVNFRMCRKMPPKTRQVCWIRSTTQSKRKCHFRQQIKKPLTKLRLLPTELPNSLQARVAAVAPRIYNSPTKDTSNRCLAWGPHPQPNPLQVIPTITRHSFLIAVWRVLPDTLANSPWATHLLPNEESRGNRDVKLAQAKK